MNTQIGIFLPEFNFTSLAAAHLENEAPEEFEFVDFLLLSPFTQTVDNLTTARFDNESIASPMWAVQSSFEFANSHQPGVESGHQKLAELTRHEIVESKLATATTSPSIEPPVDFVHSHTPHDLPTIGEKSVSEPLGTSVSRQTIAAIENLVIRSTPPAMQSITVEIHPRDLGQLNIQIEVVADSIQARIVASETLSAELLNRNKDQLVNALAEFGYSQTDVDISHQNSQSQQSWEEEYANNGSVLVGQNTVSPTTKYKTHPALLVGVDLVA